MAILHMNIPSEAMGRTVTLNAYVPAEALKEGEELKALYLLHGVQGSYINWAMSTNLSRIAALHNMAVMESASLEDSAENGAADPAKRAKRLAIFMPSAGNGFYHKIPGGDDPSWHEPFGHKHDYETFFGEELPLKMQAMFPLSPLREDTAIAGLSMGGYGALRTALLYPERFSLAGGLSSALMTRRSREELDAAGFWADRDMRSLIFGDFEKARTDEREDVESAILAKHARGEKLPEIYLACGSSDPLLPLSRNLSAALTAAGVPHTYEEHEGAHEWRFWEWGLTRLLTHL